MFSKQLIAMSALFLVFGFAITVVHADPPSGTVSTVAPAEAKQPMLHAMRSDIDSPRTDGHMAMLEYPVVKSEMCFETKDGEHPLQPALTWAKAGLAEYDAKVKDCATLLVKRERLNGRLTGPEYMNVKVRREPFSVYIEYLKPQKLQGREVIYVEGKNNGDCLAHGTGFQKMLGTLNVSPTGSLASRFSRYPLTSVGIANLVERLIEVAEKDVQQGECQVKYHQNVKIQGRPCFCIQVMHPNQRPYFTFYKAMIYVDRETNLPIRYESYYWPSRPGGAPILLEEYTYLNMKFNVGLSDIDFSVNNPKYDF